MKVSLVSLTSPCVGASGTSTPEGLIVYTARVSNPSSQEAGENNEKLIQYLIRNKHWSPFEMVDMTVEIETSRAIAAQILRHRSFSFQEFSQRYATANLGFETYTARRQDVKNRQNSIDDLPEETKDWFVKAQRNNEMESQALYLDALNRGIAKEQARMLLPMSTRTRLYMKGGIRSWIHYLEARLHPSTQKEHRDVALSIARIFTDAFPIIAAAISLPTS